MKILGIELRFSIEGEALCTFSTRLAAVGAYLMYMPGRLAPAATPGVDRGVGLPVIATVASINSKNVNSPAEIIPDLVVSGLILFLL
jgi:hypothetical protein